MNKKLLFGILLTICLILGFVSTTMAADILLKEGMKGALVSKVQNYLHQLNYLRQEPTGYYGRITVEAVKSFQLENSLEASGITDLDTFNAMQSCNSLKNSSIEYTVQPSESLPEIATKFNTSSAAIMVKNSLTSNEIVVGQKLIIPVAIGNGNRSTISRGRLGGVQEIPWSIIN